MQNQTPRTIFRYGFVCREKYTTLLLILVLNLPRAFHCTLEGDHLAASQPPPQAPLTLVYPFCLEDFLSHTYTLTPTLYKALLLCLWPQRRELCLLGEQPHR